jgi:hypothetical protein
MVMRKNGMINNSFNKKADFNSNQYDLSKIIEYCKKNNKKIEDLTQQELNKFLK